MKLFFIILNKRSIILIKNKGIILLLIIFKLKI
jgi:hypothetical protein